MNIMKENKIKMYIYIVIILQKVSKSAN